MARVRFKDRSQSGLKIEGLDELIDKIEALAALRPRTRAPLKRAMRQATAIVAKQVRTMLRMPGRSGAFYKLPGRAGLHQASAPGEVPAKIDADLAASVRTVVSRRGYSGRIVTGDPKAHIMEYGSEKQEARPFLRPALAAKSAEILATLRAGYREAIATLFGRHT